MIRPDFITTEQITTWDLHLKQDQDLLGIMPEELINQPEIKEVLYAGLWLVDQLRNFGQDEQTVMDIQYAHGRQSFGNDPWIIAKIFSNAYKHSAPLRKIN